MIEFKLKENWTVVQYILRLLFFLYIEFYFDSNLECVEQNTSVYCNQIGFAWCRRIINGIDGVDDFVDIIYMVFNPRNISGQKYHSHGQILYSFTKKVFVLQTDKPVNLNAPNKSFLFYDKW